MGDIKYRSKFREVTLYQDEQKRLMAVEDFFDGARLAGLQEPTLYFNGFTLKGRRKGAMKGSVCIYKKGHLLGGKLRNGRFWATPSGIKTDFSAVGSAVKTLLTLGTDVSGIVRSQGKETGVCVCCGRELTDPKSIEAGIGPVCAKKWGD
jgi:hypothetical protein